MASRTEIILVDDLDGSEIHQGGETLRFTVDGADYEIDLSSANAEKFRSAVRPFVERGRRVRGRAPAAPTRGTTRIDREQLKAARTWLRAHGHEVSDRGRVKAELMEIYLTQAGR
ncbi:MAG: Lsr2 family protein [Dermatophilaceae bacterium]